VTQKVNLKQWLLTSCTWAVSLGNCCSAYCRNCMAVCLFRASRIIILVEHTHRETCSRCYIQWALLLKFHCQDNQTASYRILFVTYIQKWQVSSEIHQMWCSQTYTSTSFPKLVSAFFKNNTAILDLPIHLGSYHTAHFPSHSSNLLFRFLCHTFYKDAEATQCVTKSQSAGSGCNGDDCTTYWHVCIMLRTSI